MNPKSYHTPPQPISTRVRCPVCRQEVYSRAGIHPQCAVRQSDPPRPRNKAAVASSLVVPAAQVGDQRPAVVAPPSLELLPALDFP